MRNRLGKILERWFIVEPAMFQVMCSHDFVENTGMKCPFRSGCRRMEYNPDLLAGLSDADMEKILKIEAIRILLKHPYERRPDNCCAQAISIGSNITIGDNYACYDCQTDKPADFNLIPGMHYEWYARQIQQMLQEVRGQSPVSQKSGRPASADQTAAGPASEMKAADMISDESDKKKPDNRFSEERAAADRDLSELWDEDEVAVTIINGIISNCRSWGSLAGNFAEKLIASTKATIDWRNILCGFRSSILSSGRKLTRMRPNRRTGFQNMGSIRRFNTRLLVAVDVSGSISSASISYFYGVINSSFRYGFESIDVIQFDCGIQIVQNLKKVIKETPVIGRGGTSFQEPIDYANEHGYDGLIILTDGEAPEPSMPDNMRCKIVWVCQDSGCYDRNHEWMENLGRVCTMQLR